MDEVDEFIRCRKWLEDALEYNDTGQTLQDVWVGMQSGEYRLWPGERCAVVTEHFENTQGKHLSFFLAGGDIAELETMLPKIEACARDDGVVRITLYGRRGWEKSFLRSAGYKTHWVVMTKDMI
jgi:hypothetical protein